MFRTAVTMSALAAMVAPAYAMEWMTDFDDAREKALTENKPLLVDFTGSDWCYYCKVLSEKVFSTPEFAAYAEGKFIPVEVDLPRSKEMDARQRERNTAVSRQYRVTGFPTVLVLSPQGDILGGFVGGASSLAQIQPTLDSALENAKLLETAKASTGLRRAQAFAKLYTSLSDDLKTQAEAYKKEILDNDPDNATGVRDIFAAEQEMRALALELQNAKDFASAISLVDAKLPTVMPANKMQLLIIKSRCMTMIAESEADILKAKQVAMDAAGLIPDAQDADKLRAAVEKEYADPAALLKKVQDTRNKHR